MFTLIAGSLILSVLHALIPNHWLPVLAISKKENWSLRQTTSVTFIAGLSHALSTVIIGVVFSLIGLKLNDNYKSFTNLFAPIVLIALGMFFIYQHYKHNHFHVHQQQSLSRNKVIISLAIAMFFSPCFEIEAYFLMAGSFGWWMVWVLAILYTIVTVGGMVIWVRIAYAGIIKFNWHQLEHNAGIITGVTLVITGILSFFIH